MFKLHSNVAQRGRLTRFNTSQCVPAAQLCVAPYVQAVDKALTLHCYSCVNWGNGGQRGQALSHLSQTEAHDLQNSER